MIIFIHHSLLCDIGLPWFAVFIVEFQLFCLRRRTHLSFIVALIYLFQGELSFLGYTVIHHSTSAGEWVREFRKHNHGRRQLVG